MGTHVRFSAKVLIVRTADGNEHQVPLAEIADDSPVQDVCDFGDLIVNRAWAEIAGMFVPPEPIQEEAMNAQKELQGILFRSDKKTSAEHSDYRGARPSTAPSIGCRVGSKRASAASSCRWHLPTNLTSARAKAPLRRGSPTTTICASDGGVPS
jgi:hypothetical protein